MILASSVAAADLLAKQLGPLVGSDDDRSLRIDRARDLADLRNALSAEVSALDAAILIGTFAVAAVLVAINLFGVIAERRRELGLRRTQGASRSLVAALVMLEVGALAVFGSGLGAIGGMITVFVSPPSRSWASSTSTRPPIAAAA